MFKQYLVITTGLLAAVLLWSATTLVIPTHFIGVQESEHGSKYRIYHSGVYLKPFFSPSIRKIPIQPSLYAFSVPYQSRDHQLLTLHLHVDYYYSIDRIERYSPAFPLIPVDELFLKASSVASELFSSEELVTYDLASITENRQRLGNYLLELSKMYISKHMAALDGISIVNVTLRH